MLVRCKDLIWLALVQIVDLRLSDLGFTSLPTWMLKDPKIQIKVQIVRVLPVALGKRVSRVIGNEMAVLSTSQATAQFVRSTATGSSFLIQTPYFKLALAQDLVQHTDFSRPSLSPQLIRFINGSPTRPIVFQLFNGVMHFRIALLMVSSSLISSLYNHTYVDFLRCSLLYLRRWRIPFGYHSSGISVPPLS